MKKRIIPKEFENLSILDSFIFESVLEDPLLCKSILETLLQRPVGDVSAIPDSPRIRLGEGNKLIRFDLYSNLLSRYSTRYRSCLADANSFAVSGSYRHLHDHNVISICSFDPAGANEACYTMASNSSTLSQESFTHNNYFFNTSAVNNIPTDIKNLFSYMNKGIVCDALTEWIADRVDVIRQNGEKKRQYCRSVNHLKEVLYHARRDGSISILMKMIKSRVLKGQTIMDITDELTETQKLFSMICPLVRNVSLEFEEE